MKLKLLRKLCEKYINDNNNEIADFMDKVLILPDKTIDYIILNNIDIKKIMDYINSCAFSNLSSDVQIYVLKNDVRVINLIDSSCFGNVFFGYDEKEQIKVLKCISKYENSSILTFFIKVLSKDEIVNSEKEQQLRLIDAIDNLKNGNEYFLALELLFKNLNSKTCLPKIIDVINKGPSDMLAYYILHNDMLKKKAINKKLAAIVKDKNFNCPIYLSLAMIDALHDGRIKADYLEIYFEEFSSCSIINITNALIMLYADEIINYDELICLIRRYFSKSNDGFDDIKDISSFLPYKDHDKSNVNQNIKTKEGP